LLIAIHASFVSGTADFLDSHHLLQPYPLQPPRGLETLRNLQPQQCPPIAFCHSKYASSFMLFYDHDFKNQEFFSFSKL
jgi:hypothetical protein